MSKTVAAEQPALAGLDDRNFIVAVLRDIAGHAGEDAVIRLKAVDRLAVVTGVYVIEQAAAV